jgi:hypothetical protein
VAQSQPSTHADTPTDATWQRDSVSIATTSHGRKRSERVFGPLVCLLKRHHKVACIKDAGPGLADYSNAMVRHYHWCMRCDLTERYEDEPMTPLGV